MSLNYDFPITLSQDDLTVDDQCDNLDDQIASIAVKKEAMNMQQSAAWGMRAVQSFTMVFKKYGEKRIIFNY